MPVIKMWDKIASYLPLRLIHMVIHRVISAPGLKCT